MHHRPVADAPAIETMLAHRSIRRFKPDAVPDADINRAIEAGQMASTSSNVQAYCAIRVTDPEIRAGLAQLAGPQQKVVDCGAFFVICGDVRRHRLLAEAAGEPYEAKLEAFLVAVIDASLFAQNACIAFEAMGYGICYIGGLRNDLPRVGDLLHLPQGVYPLFGLCVGVPDETPGTRPRFDTESVLFENRYPADDEVMRHILRYDTFYERYMQSRSGSAASWSAMMASKYTRASRIEVGPYYRSQGANLT
ncbi:MAG: NADPH-dependent oxidoreductase [Phycisphaerales bacterium]